MLYRYVNDFPFPWKIQICLIQIVKFTRIGIAPPPGKNYLPIPPPWKKRYSGFAHVYKNSIYSLTWWINFNYCVPCYNYIHYMYCSLFYYQIKGQITLTARKENLEHCKNCLIFSSTTLIYSFQFKMLDSFCFLYCSRP